MGLTAASSSKSLELKLPITKFSRMASLPHFLTHVAPQARFARRSSANIYLHRVLGENVIELAYFPLVFFLSCVFLMKDK